PLTIYQAIQLASAKQLIPETMDELSIHYLGPERELYQLAVFGELHALLPGVQLHIDSFGSDTTADKPSAITNYHDRYEELTKEFLPDIAPGISAYRSWSPTIVCLISLGADKRIEIPAISPITVKMLVILQQTDRTRGTIEVACGWLRLYIGDLSVFVVFWWFIFVYVILDPKCDHLIACLTYFYKKKGILCGDDPKKKGGASGSNTELTLFLHANDTNGTPLIIFKLTGNDNYKIWAAAVHLALHAKNKFLMGLDDTYNVVRSQILTTGLDVKYAFSTLSRFESHKNILVHTSSASPSPSAFVSNNRPNAWTNNRNNQNRGFKKGNSGGTSVSNNASSSVVKSDQSAGPPSPFTTDQINRIMALISLNSDSGELQSCAADVKFYETVIPFKNETMKKDLIFEENGINSLNFFDDVCDQAVDYSNEPYDDKRDNEKGDSDGILKSPDYAEVSTDTSSTATNGLGSTGASPKGSDATLFNEEYEFKGEDFIESNQLFNSELTSNPESSVLRRSSRQHKMLAKFDNYVLIIDAKYNINSVIKFPRGKDIGSKWIFKMKYKSSWDVERFKAILVAQGFRQKEGIDYEETFSPIVKIVTVVRKYCMQLLSEYGMLACKPAKAPIPDESKKRKDKEITETGHVLNNITCYQKIVGKLIYLTMTRPYIAYVVHCLSQLLHAPCQSHLKLAFHVLRYLKCSPETGISFKPDSNLNLSAYKSKKQSILAKSSAEAEYRAMNSVTCEVMWILKIFKDLNVNVDLHVSVSCDRSSAIQIAANLVFHERTKHFEIGLYFLRKKVFAGLIEICKITSEEIVADLFTKGLSIKDH
ncbi:ribonuclease H-like domain-containing protein, partial [Tanacetum coccineum]